MNLTIVRKNIKNINITIRSNGEVLVSAPKRVSKRYIDELIKKKTPWIKKKLDYFKGRKSLTVKKSYDDGEKIYYLGEEFILKVVECSEERVWLEDGFLWLGVRSERDIAAKERLVDSWYLSKAKKLFEELVKKYQKIVKRDIKIVRIKKMKTRWGSCNHVRGYINLNLYLIQRDIKEIEYVVLHELAHLIYPNHSKEFYNYIASIMPDWKERRIG